MPVIEMTDEEFKLQMNELVEAFSTTIVKVGPHPAVATVALIATLVAVDDQHGQSNDLDGFCKLVDMTIRKIAQEKMN